MTDMTLISIIHSDLTDHPLRHAILIHKVDDDHDVDIFSCYYSSKSIYKLSNIIYSIETKPIVNRLPANISDANR